jgi:hypothetical protein
MKIPEEYTVDESHSAMWALLPLTMVTEDSTLGRRDQERYRRHWVFCGKYFDNISLNIEYFSTL